MLTFKFSVEEENLGHMTLIKDNEIVTTSQVPPQSMMIYVAIADLIDGIIALIKEKRNNFLLIGADCSFGFNIKRTKNNTLTIITQEDRKIITSENELVNSVWNAILDFLPFINSLEHDDVEFENIYYMMQKFKKEFSLSYR